MADYYLLNSDGTTYSKIDIGTIKSNEKLVAESDLLTVKGSAETTQKRLESELADAKKRSDELLTRAQTAETALEESKKELEPLKVEAEKVPNLTTELNALKEKHSAAETQLLTTRRNSLIQTYKLDGDKKTQVESMSAEQLDHFEEAAKLIGVPNGSNGSNFDRTPSHSNSSENPSAYQQIKSGLGELQSTSSSHN